MSRELLQRCLNRFIRVGYEGTLVDDLENYLAEPEAPFVRLSEEEVNSLTYAPLEPYELICAVENRLVEKNRG